MTAKKYIFVIAIIIFTLLIALVFTLMHLNPAPKKPKLVLKNTKDFQKLSSNTEFLELGRNLYEPHCSRCHGPQAQGAAIGPNLIDNYWLHGDGSLRAIAKVIRDGVSDKGMPAWGFVYDLKKIEALTVYIHSLQGIEAENAKAPQGKKSSL